MEGRRYRGSLRSNFALQHFVARLLIPRKGWRALEEVKRCFRGVAKMNKGVRADTQVGDYLFLGEYGAN